MVNRIITTVLVVVIMFFALRVRVFHHNKVIYKGWLADWKPFHGNP